MKMAKPVYEQERGSNSTPLFYDYIFGISSVFFLHNHLCLRLLQHLLELGVGTEAGESDAAGIAASFDR